MQCESEIELAADSRVCPVCGLDPDLPAVAFDDAPAFFLSQEPQLSPIPVVADRAHALRRSGR